MGEECGGVGGTLGTGDFLLVSGIYDLIQSCDAMMMQYGPMMS